MEEEKINNLSKREEADDELRKSESRYRIMIENIPLGIFRMDNEGTIQDCNEIFVKLMGSKQQNLLFQKCNR